MVPVLLEMRNFFSHKDSSIDFTQFDSALLIGNVEGNYDVSNGSGKSAIFEGILWCLFNKARVASMDDVIFWGENFCKVSFTFKHGGELFRVIRKRSRVSSTSSVEFSRQDSHGNWIDISGSTASLTNAEIVKVIRFDYKTFVNSAYFRQNDISEFAETDASRKKEILKSIIDISKWDEYEASIKGSLKELRGECKVLAAGLEGYENLVEEYDSSQILLKSTTEDLQKNKKSRDILNSSLQSMTERYQEMKSSLDTDRWDKTVDALEKLRGELKFTTEKFKTASDSYKEYEDVVKNKTKTIEEYQQFADEIKVDEEAEDKLEALSKDFVDIKSKLATSVGLLKSVEDREISKGQCYVCKQAVGEELYDELITKHDEEIEEHNRVIIYCKNKLKEIKSKKASLEKAVADKKKKSMYLSKVRTIGMELKIAQERFEEIKKEKEALSLRGSTLQTDIKNHEAILDSIRDDSFRDLQKTISKKKEELTELRSVVERLNHDVGVLTEKTSNLKSKIDSVQDTRKQYLEKQQYMSTLEKMVKLLGKNGIQTILLNAVIEDLEKTSNEILTSICNEPFTVFLDTQRIGSDGVSVIDTLDLRVKKEGIVQNFKSLSGGEKFRISLALRIALSEISSRHGGSALEFLLLDEINSPLDRQGTESLFANVINALEKKYKILVITHNDSLKEKFNDVLDITKVNGESSVNYISI